MRYSILKNFFAIVLSMTVLFSVGSSMVAHADRDDDEDGDRSERRVEQIVPVAPVVQQPVAPITAPTPKPIEVKVEKPKTIKKVIVPPPVTILVDEIKNIEFPDTDRDGLIDSEDLHPNIPEIYFVSDNNQNGIVDIFEQ